MPTEAAILRSTRVEKRAKDVSAARTPATSSTAVGARLSPVVHPLADVEKTAVAQHPMAEAVNYALGHAGGRTAILARLTSTCRWHGVDPQLYFARLLMNLPQSKLSALPEWAARSVGNPSR